MNRLRVFLLVGVAFVLGAQPALSQSSPADYRDEFLEHFGRSSEKMSALSRAIPAELYTWSPEGAMTIARVYMHIARYNFMYLQDNLGIPAPHEIEMDKLESVTDKETIVRVLDQSIAHVQEHAKNMSEQDLTRMTVLYGRDVAGWAVLAQLISHMNEHVGQSIAYARMNNIVPPWSS